MNANTLQSFDQARDSILILIRCADTYGLHTISLFQGEIEDANLIERTIKDKEVGL